MCGTPDSLNKSVPISPLFLQMSICKIHKAVPVVRRHVVPAGADVIADGAEDRL